MTIKNQIKTVLLLGGLTGLFLLIGALAGGKTGMTIALIFAGGMNCQPRVPTTGGRSRVLNTSGMLALLGALAFR